MEKILFPLKYMKVTQGMNGAYSHKGTFAIDYGTGGDEKIYAPFTGTIKKIYNTGKGSANGTWLLSNEKVQFADGSIDYAVFKCAHDNDISDLYVGKVIKQGQHFYNMGTAGNATGKHVHIEIAKGNKVGWYENNDGNWMITNSIDQTKAFFVPSDVKIVKNGGYTWKPLIEYLGTPVKRDLYVDQVEVKVDNLRARKEPNGEKLGYINKGIYNVLETKQEADYKWFRVEANIWIAYNAEWENYFTATQKELTKEELQNEIENLNKKIVSLNTIINNQQDRIKALENKETFKFEFKVPRTERYAIDLKEGEIIKIG